LLRILSISKENKPSVDIYDLSYRNVNAETLIYKTINVFAYKIILTHVYRYLSARRTFTPMLINAEFYNSNMFILFIL